MEIILTGQAEIEGNVQVFQIRQHAWFSEMVVKAYGLDAFPVIPSVLDWRIGTGNISILHEEGGRRVWTVLNKYRPIVRL